MRKYFVYRNSTERVIIDADNPIEAIAKSRDSYNWQSFNNPRFMTMELSNRNNFIACADCSWKSDKEACRTCKLIAL